MSYNAEPKDWYRVDKFLHKVPFDQVADVYNQCDISVKDKLSGKFFISAVRDDGNRWICSGCSE